MKITQDRSIFHLDLEARKQQPIWSVRRRSAEYYMGTSLYMLGTVSFRETEDAPWSHYYVSLTEMLPCTNIPRWSPLNATLLYDNTLIEQVTYEEAEKVFQSQM